MVQKGKRKSKEVDEYRAKTKGKGNLGWHNCVVL